MLFSVNFVDTAIECLSSRTHIYVGYILLLKQYFRSENGGVAFEAIWVVLILAFFIAPTVYLLSYSDDHLTASWDQRTAARSMAANGSCSTGGYNPIPITGSTGTNSVTLITCSADTDGEQDMPNGDRFWRKMETATNPHFHDLTRDLRDHGNVVVVEGQSLVTMTDTFNVGEDGGTAGLLGSALSGDLTHSSEILVPSTDYWTFKEDHWKAGHDQVICDGFTSDSRKMFPNVFPSSDKCSGGSGASSSSPPSPSNSSVVAAANPSTGGLSEAASGTLPVNSGGTAQSGQPSSFSTASANALSGSGGNNGFTNLGSGQVGNLTGGGSTLQTGSFDTTSLSTGSFSTQSTSLGRYASLGQQGGSAGATTAQPVVMRPINSKYSCPEVEGYWNDLVQEYGGDRYRMKNIADDTVYACMSGDVYEDNNQFMSTCVSNNGWERIPGVSQQNVAGGSFHNDFYFNPKTKECVIAFEGSELFEGEWASENLRCLREGSTEQAKQAILVAEAAKRASGGACKTWTMTGHSMGGRLAQIAASAMDEKAVGFNSAYMCPNDHRLIEDFKNGKDINSVVYRGIELWRSGPLEWISSAYQVGATGYRQHAKDFSESVNEKSHWLKKAYSGYLNGSSKVTDGVGDLVEIGIVLLEDGARLAIHSSPIFPFSPGIQGSEFMQEGYALERMGDAVSQSYGNVRTYRCSGDPLSHFGHKHGRGDQNVEGCEGDPGDQHSINQLAERMQRVSTARDVMNEYQTALTDESWDEKPLDEEHAAKMCEALENKLNGITNTPYEHILDQLNAKAEDIWDQTKECVGGMATNISPWGVTKAIFKGTGESVVNQGGKEIMNQVIPYSGDAVGLVQEGTELASPVSDAWNKGDYWGLAGWVSKKMVTVPMKVIGGIYGGMAGATGGPGGIATGTKLGSAVGESLGEGVHAGAVELGEQISDGLDHCL